MDVFFIAEIGQNHNGDFDKALELIDMAAAPVYFQGEKLRGVDAVKFQKRDLEHEMTSEMARTEYTGPNSFASTYGLHRDYLEFDGETHAALADAAHEKGLLFIDTVCNPGAVDQLAADNVQVDRLKVASRDLTNYPLLKAVAQTKIPTILSTGMHDLNRVEDAVEHFLGQGGELCAVLHCVSKYPTSIREAALGRIPQLQFRYGAKVGYSDHTVGILAPALAVALGARFIEKHITLDRGFRGSDHRASLAPEGLARCIRDVRNAEYAISDKMPVVGTYKIGRSLAVNADLPKGHIITTEDLIMVSPGGGLTWGATAVILGTKLLRPMETNEQFTVGDLQEMAG